MNPILRTIFFVVITWHHTTASIACNGYEELCARRLNEITLLGAHNIGHKDAKTQNQKYSFSQLLTMGVRFAKVRILGVPAFLFKDAPQYSYQKKNYVAVACHGLRRRALYDELQIKELLQAIPVEQLRTKYDNEIKQLKAEIARAEKSSRKSPERKGLFKKKAALKYKETMRKVKSPFLHIVESKGDKLTKSQVALLKATVGTDAMPGPLPFNPCMVDPSAQPFIETLTDIKKFLDTHPHDVFVLLIEDYINNLDVISTLLKRAGLDPLLYAHTQGTPWPTLEEMIKKNKRLVLFVQYWTAAKSWGRYPWKKHPWLHEKTDYFVDTKFEFHSAKELLNSTEVTPLSPQRPDQLVLMQHFVTKKIGGDPKQAAQVNLYSAIIKRTQAIGKQVNRTPNIVNFDFVGVPTINDQLKAVRHMNGVGEFKDNPLFTP